MSSQTLAQSDIGKRAEELYEREIKSLVEPDHIGKIIAIDIDSGEYEVDDSLLAASKRLKERRPDGTFFALRIGYNSVAAIGTKLRRTA